MNVKIIMTTLLLLGAAVIPFALGEEINSTKETEITNVTNGNLTATINGPESGYLNTPIEFQGSAQGGVAPYIYEWDFGDGTETILIESPTHTYTKTGSFTITLTVTDSALYEEQETTTTTTITIEKEQIDPTVTITQPKKGMYVNNNQLFSMEKTVIIGDITIKADAVDHESGIKNVTFTIGNEKSEEIIIPPYEYLWDTANFGTVTITATAYDHTGNSATDELSVVKLF